MNMKTVWKFEIEEQDFIELNLPVGAKPLSVHPQIEGIFMWVLLDPNEKQMEQRYFRLCGTGHPMDDSNYEFIGTVQLLRGSLVFHLFEIL